MIACARASWLVIDSSKFITRSLSRFADAKPSPTWLRITASHPQEREWVTTRVPELHVVAV